MSEAGTSPIRLRHATTGSGAPGAMGAILAESLERPAPAPKNGAEAMTALRNLDKALENGEITKARMQEAVAACIKHPHEGVALAGVQILAESKILACAYAARINGQPETRPSWNDDATESLNQAFARDAMNALAKRAVSEAGERNEVLTPLLARVFKVILEKDHGKVKCAPGKGPEEEARGALERFKAWLEQVGHNECRGIAALDRRTHGELMAVAAKHARSLSTVDGVVALHKLVAENLDVVMENPFLTRESARAISESAIDQVVWEQKLSDARGFFTTLHKRGFCLDQTQIQRLRIAVAMLKVTGNSAILLEIASIPDAANDPQVRSEIIAGYRQTNAPEIHLWLHLLCASQKWAWIETLVQTPEEDKRSGIFKRALAKCGAWNVKGMRREHLLILLKSEDADLRAEGLRLVTLLQEVAEGA